MAFKLEIPAFSQGGAIPPAFTSEGPNHSPALHWSGAPEGTKSFALIMDDPDAPGGTWNHWLVWNLPAGIHELGEKATLPKSAQAGTNDFGKTGYGGPAPPRGHGPHRYFFRLYALDVEDLPVRAGARRRELEQGLTAHVLAQAEYMGTFERK